MKIHVFLTALLFLVIGDLSAQQMSKQDSLDLINNPPQVIVLITEPQDSTVEEVLLFSEVMPSFKGGQAAFEKYLQDNITHPTSSADTGITGTVYIYFEVNKDGSIGLVKCQYPIKGHPAFCEEAVRVIQTMPKWDPGTNGGKPVKVGMTVPVKFEKN